jgi:hypothetical protein
LDVTQAFVPSLTRSHGAVVNVVSLGAVAAVPVLPACSVSKAALSVTQSLRAQRVPHSRGCEARRPGANHELSEWSPACSGRLVAGVRARAVGLVWGGTVCPFVFGWVGSGARRLAGPQVVLAVPLVLELG